MSDEKTYTQSQVNELLKHMQEKERELLTNIICDLNNDGPAITICEGFDVKDGVIEYCTNWSRENGKHYIEDDYNNFESCKYCGEGPSLCQLHSKNAYFRPDNEETMCAKCYDEFKASEDENQNENENENENE